MEETLPFLVPLVVALGVADAAAQPAGRFRAVGQRKWPWIVGQILLPVVGTLAYALTVRFRMAVEAPRDGEG